MKNVLQEIIFPGNIVNFKRITHIVVPRRGPLHCCNGIRLILIAELRNMLHELLYYLTLPISLSLSLSLSLSSLYS